MLPTSEWNKDGGGDKKVKFPLKAQLCSMCSFCLQCTQNKHMLPLTGSHHSVGCERLQPRVSVSVCQCVYTVCVFLHTLYLYTVRPHILHVCVYMCVFLPRDLKPAKQIWCSHIVWETVPVGTVPYIRPPPTLSAPKPFIYLINLPRHSIISWLFWQVLRNVSLLVGSIVFLCHNFHFHPKKTPSLHTICFGGGKHVFLHLEKGKNV